ncbi:MAG: DUF2723 domain-containing protein [Chloroflexia bacterium]|nr:DUF2723 domain-containing protein [Chloroflexia bacterium]
MKHPHPSRQGWPGYWGDLALAGLAYITSLGFYLATLSPGLSYLSPDGNELIVICATLGLAHSTGYPLYTWLGKLFSLLPLGTVAYRVNLMSAVLGAAAAALLYGLMRLLTRHRGVALFTALFFALSRAFWSQAVIAEVYATNMLLVASTLLSFLLWAQRRRAGDTRSDWLLLLAILALGLSVGTHMSNLGFVPAYGLFVLLVYPLIWRRPALILGAALAFGLGLLQYLWLPLKADNLTDALMMRNSPTTWRGFYNYTLGAFPQMKFAFSLPEIPERIVLYLELLRQNVGLGGIVLGLYGWVELLWRRTRHFYLLMGMYLVHVFFFVQYRVFDLDVFFIPAHFLYFIVIGYGLACLLDHLRNWSGRAKRRWLPPALKGLLALPLLLGALASQILGNYGVNDHSGDTAAEDFYENVFALLPPGSVLLGQGGVFGYDMFYYPLVLDLRPDVYIPPLENPGGRPQELQGAPIYTTIQGAKQRGPGQLDPRMLPQDAWYIPLLLGESGGETGGGLRKELVLYRLSEEPPRLVRDEARPLFPLGVELDGLCLEGYDLAQDRVEAGGCLQLTLYWRVLGRPRGMLATALGEQALERHTLGLGNLERYAQEVRPPDGRIVVEEYALVVPSDLEPGAYPLRVGLVAPRQTAEENWVELGQVEVTGKDG